MYTNIHICSFKYTSTHMCIHLHMYTQISIHTSTNVPILTQVYTIPTVNTSYTLTQHMEMTSSSITVLMGSMRLAGLMMRWNARKDRVPNLYSIGVYQAYIYYMCVYGIKISLCVCIAYV